ncbi:MAG: phosphoglycerate kinase [Bacteroidales bacterium]|nr:phosphoglycerate kinase [Bacteroidales bacterium]MDD3330008.1 phosphoglycerate kinase [Bacteroidales bacterium]MDD3690643.1 phosphoglycerate kinase [Bacteroidales bacterium]MDD4043857.1 phosphoglycerate kinase [Bacteroidales bacterium]MDD4580819.1 phosphoglycerate kinase [Bacteroidales bacterium]
MIHIEDYNFKEKKALVRVDYNVPLNENFEIEDTTRIDASLKTINKILHDGGAVILLSHLGRPNGKEYKYSLDHIHTYLQKKVDVKVFFAEDCIGEDAQRLVDALPPRKILLLENLRFHQEETKGDVEFAKELASYGDVYVNDAFSAAHREHASTAVIARFFPNDKMFGYLMQNEIDNLNKVMLNPKHPFTAILGGSKISTKIDIINNLLSKVDNIILGGGMNYTVHKAMGGDIGASLYEENMLPVAYEILKKAKQYNVNIYISVDTITANKFSNDAIRRIYPTSKIPDNVEGMDIGPESCVRYREVIMNSETILWNGPLGVFEFDNFSNGTFMVADAVVKATENGSFSLVGGGDTISSINKFKLADKFNYVSTAGGAMLEFCEGRVLPGIKSILEE